MKILLLQKLLDKNFEKTFLISGEKHITYGQFLILVSKICNFLISRPEKYIFINAEKNEFTLAAYFACAKLGKIAAFIDPMSKSPKQFLSLSNNGFYFSSTLYDELKNYDYTMIDNADQTEDNEMSEIIFTTGTTGNPKGVLLSHNTVYMTAKNINKFTNLKSTDVEMHMMPISHSFGLARIRCCVIAGCPIVLHNGFGNLNSFFESLEKNKGSVISTVPAGILFLLKLAQGKIKNFSDQVRMIELGSAPMTKEEKMLLLETLPLTDICMHYGLTEASRSTFLNFNNDIDYIDSVGKPNFGTNLLILNSKKEKCKVNELGEICIKGTNLFTNYIFTESKASFYNDYFQTGDYGYLNDHGYLFFQARKDEMMNIAGKKVSPLEIEKYLNRLSYIKESACVQSRNLNTGLDEIKAYIVLNPFFPIDKNFSSNINFEIKKELKKYIEYYKIPTSIVNIGKIPKSSNGKILRNKLKEK